MESLRENAEKAMKLANGSSVANRALELIGTELGMFRSDGPPKPLNVEGLTAKQIREMLGDAAPPKPRRVPINGNAPKPRARELTLGFPRRTLQPGASRANMDVSRSRLPCNGRREGVIRNLA